MTQTTRLAPSPTGALHLGNARTFLINWLIARQRGWRILLRIEDLDGPRIKRGADAAAIEDLRWLGLDWDDGVIHQSQRRDAYAAAIHRLLERGLAYPCICTRREAALAASAPHAEDGAEVYPGTCRDRFVSVDEARAACGREPAIRFRVPAAPITFEDAFRGLVRFDDPPSQLGDFVIAKADGSAAYQLAVVVDDAATGVTQVVRGDDLVDSTPRQMLLYHALQLDMQIPTYTHLPLVVGSDGRRLAKRHGDTRLSYYRANGVPPQRVLGLLARWCGLDVGDEPSLEHLVKHFRLEHLPRERVVIKPGDESFLFPPRA
jgi:glutamyl-tRNA synthetase